MSSQTKQEKKIMDEKIAKVREVVRNVSTNDIVLALHNFELDVERTIHAFCEGGSEGALGAWETGGAAKKKQKNKGVKAPAPAPVVPANNLANAASSRARPAGQPQQTAVPPPAATVSSTNNGYMNGYSTTTLSNGGSVNGDKGPASQPQAASNGNASSLKKGQNKSSSTGISAPVAPDVFENIPPKANVGPKKLEKNYSKLDGSQAEADLFKCFQEIRQILDKRESQLIGQLAQCQQEETRFCYDNSKLINDITHLGEVVANRNDISLVSHGVANPLVNGQQSVNHSTSHSSLVSSVGETDSGLGQTSPVSQEKSVAHVDNGGIVMQSDALSADQLADLQRRIEETLRSQGIDPSVLSEFSQSVAPRKRVPNKSNGGAGNRRDGDNRSDTSARNQKAKAVGEKQQQMKLSIFQ